jgi:hypothetical protein
LRIQPSIAPPTFSRPECDAVDGTLDMESKDAFRDVGACCEWAGGAAR